MSDEFDNLDAALELELMNYYDISRDFQKPSTHSEVLLNELISEKKHLLNKSVHATGGSKTVSKIDDLRTARTIAMAELRNDKDGIDLDRFLYEARITAALEHPNIIPIYDIGINESGKPYFTMKFLKDQSLEKILKEVRLNTLEYKENYPLEVLLEIFVKICEAISYAHSRGVIHLDLKPDNIMIGEYGEVYVCDWGLAKLLHEKETDFDIGNFDADLMNDITLTGMVKGTPGYMAPEQISSKFGPKNRQSDIYSLGAILYALLVNKAPYSNLDAKTVLQRTVAGKVEAPQKKSPNIPDSLNAIVVKAMSFEQRHRYKEVKDIIKDVRKYQQGFATGAENAGFLKSLLLLFNRHRGVTFLLLCILMTSTYLGFMVKRNEMKAQSSLKLYLREKEVRKKKIIASIPTMLKGWEASLYSLETKWLIEQLDELLEISPKNNRLLKFKAWQYITQHNFDDAQVLYWKNTSSSKADLKLFLENCRRDIRQQGYVSVSTALHCLTQNNFFSKMPVISKKFLGNVFKQLPNVEDKKLLIMQALCLFQNNRLLKSLPKVYPLLTEKGKGKWHLDFSTLKGIRWLNGLDFFPIYSMSFLETSLVGFPSALNPHIERLDFSCCYSLKYLSGLKKLPRLKYVTLPPSWRKSEIASYLRKKRVRIDYL